MGNLLEVKNLTKRYKKFTLDNVSFEIPGGAIMGFIGENGAGKTTTIQLILDMIERDGGEISIFGESNKKNFIDKKNDIGFVMSSSNYPEDMNAKDINSFLKHVYKNWNSDTFFNYIEKFSLDTGKAIKEYSRGMSMKLSIAVAMSHDARLLLLDEATSGLDPIVRDDILDIFYDFIQDDDHAILISSHILSDLEKICDYVTFIHKGRIVFSEEKDMLTDRYGILKCSAEDFRGCSHDGVVRVKKTSFGTEALIEKKYYRGKGMIEKAEIEDIMLFMVKGETV